MLPYDLNVLHEYVEKHGTKSLILAFRDSEAFDFGVLNDLISLLRYLPSYTLYTAVNSFQFLG